MAFVPSCGPRGLVTVRSANANQFRLECGLLLFNSKGSISSRHLVRGYRARCVGPPVATIPSTKHQACPLILTPTLALTQPYPNPYLTLTLIIILSLTLPLALSLTLHLPLTLTLTLTPVPVWWEAHPAPPAKQPVATEMWRHARYGLAACS